MNYFYNTPKNLSTTTMIITVITVPMIPLMSPPLYDM